MSFVSKFKQLKARLISAFVLMPIVIVAIWFGHYAFGVLVGVVAGFALSELWMLAKNTERRLSVFVAGAVYVLFGCFLCYALRQDFAPYYTFCFFVAMWASDACAYFCGKFIGGPKMAGSISPNKTWAGYAGALIAPVIVVMVLGMRMDIYALSALSLGVAGQAGDLLISSIKRDAHVKDTGNLIPGHGGILDRIDSLLAAVPVFLALLTAEFIF